MTEDTKKMALNVILADFQDLSNQSEATVALASRLFYDTKRQPPKTRYTQLLADHYLAGIQAVSFSQVCSCCQGDDYIPSYSRLKLQESSINGLLTKPQTSSKM